MKDTRRLFVGLASIVIATFIFNWLAGCPPATAACSFGALVSGIAFIVSAIVLIFFVDYRETWFFLRWKQFWFRRPGGPYPFPETREERTSRRPWAGETLGRFAGWTFDTERGFADADNNLRAAVERPVRRGVIEPISAVDHQDEIRALRREYDEAERANVRAKRNFHRLYRLFIAMEMYPPDLIDAEETFRVSYRPEDHERSGRESTAS